MTQAVVISNQCYISESSCLKIIVNCQAQGPTPGPTQGQGQGQVRLDSNSNSNSNVGPELYTKIGFHPPPPSLNECLVNFVTLCDTL